MMLWQPLVFCLAVGSGYSQAADALAIELKGHTGAVRSVCFSPDGKTVVSAGADETVRIWNVESGEVLQKLLGHTREVWLATFSPGGERIVTASWDRTVRIWETESGDELRKMEGVVP